MFLVDGKLWLSFVVALVVAAITAFPSLLLSLWLNLHLQQLDEEESERVMLQVVQQGIEYFTILFDKQICQQVLLLLQEKLIHDLEEVSTQDWEGILIDVQELSQLIEKGVVGSLHWLNWLFLLIILKT